jgi:hypothetical protein
MTAFLTVSGLIVAGFVTSYLFAAWAAASRQRRRDEHRMKRLREWGA